MVVAALALCLVGCEGIGFLTAMGGARKIKKIHQLADVRTAVLVDDPSDQLGDPGLKGVVASNVRFFVMDGKEVKDVIDPQEVTSLAARMGKEFEKTPIDRIGRELGVSQVIYVSIESVQLASGPGMYRPIAGVQVKVIDAAAGHRLFPAGSGTGKSNKLETDTFSPHAQAGSPKPGAVADPRGYRFNVKLPHEPSGNIKHGDPYMLQRQLAEQIGKEVAWLFVDHAPPAVGETITRGQTRYY